MPVDTTIQYNGYNSFKLLENEVISCSVFGVEGMAFITTSFQSYCPSAIATGVRMYVRFFDASNAIISTSNHSFALTASAWVKQAQTLSVPATAIKAQIFFTNPVATAWYMAQPKCEEGEVASSFTINLSAQLTHIAPDGIYTGTLTANQIIVSSTDTLDTALTAISNGQIILMSNYNSIAPKVTKITADGVYTGLVVANQISTGTLNGSLVNVTNLNASNIVAGTLSVDRLAAGSITADKIVTTNLTAARIVNPTDGNNWVELVDTVSGQRFSFISAMSGQPPKVRASITTYGQTSVLFEAQAVTDSGGTGFLGIVHGVTSLMLWSPYQATLSFGSNRIGVDSTGVYKEINNVKTYL